MIPKAPRARQPHLWPFHSHQKSRCTWSLISVSRLSPSLPHHTSRHSRKKIPSMVAIATGHQSGQGVQSCAAKLCPDHHCSSSFSLVGLGGGKAASSHQKRPQSSWWPSWIGYLDECSSWPPAYFAFLLAAHGTNISLRDKPCASWPSPSSSRCVRARAASSPS